MNNELTIRCFIRLKNKLSAFVETYETDKKECMDLFSNYLVAMSEARLRNAWFTEENCILAFKGIATMFEQNSFDAWVEHYDLWNLKQKSKKIGLIMAGNIPMVGFHDLMSVLICGHHAMVKLSSDDQVLMTLIINELINIEPTLADRIELVQKITDADAFIATGSNNSARYFEYYFGNRPNLIRRNMNSVAVLTGNESISELQNLGKDIFTYFGLGCRNVSTIFVPEGYTFEKFFEAMLPFSKVMEHNKYMNNFDYHNALFLLNKEPFLTNNFLIIRQNKNISTPVSVVHYQYYSTVEHLLNQLSEKNQTGISVLDQIQCIVSNSHEVPDAIPFGKSQSPAIDDYADKADTIDFLLKLT